MGSWKKSVGLVWAGAMLLCSLSAGNPASAAEEDNGFQAVSDAQIMSDLGVLQGDGNGVTDDYLAEPTQRIQSAILYLRLKGLEKEALSFTGKDNFADSDAVGAANRPVLAYLKAHPELGWEGVGGNRFDPLSEVTPQQFYKVLLASLGYQEGSDFAYPDTLDFAKSRGMYRIAPLESLHNRDIAASLVEAVEAQVKDGSGTLAQALANKSFIKTDALDELAYNRLDTAWDDKLGQIMVDGKGYTLYYFTKDAADPNACQGKCLDAWPIYDAEHLRVPAGLDAADFGRFQRSDGTMQVTYKGWPLYYYALDQAAGDTNGENVGKVWFVEKVPSYTVMLGTNPTLGNYLTDAKGNTLYYYDKDTIGKSNCSGGCLAAWPSFYADQIVVPTGVNPDDFGTITRADGTLQSTYKGYPLYYYTPDEKRGDTTGQGVGKVWYVINPSTFTGTTAEQKLEGQ